MRSWHANCILHHEEKAAHNLKRNIMNMKKYLRSKLIHKIFLFLVLPFITIAAAHKFYVSVTNMEYDEEDQAFQITTRIFIDDLETALNARYEVDAQLASEQEIEESDALISKYLDTKISITINGQQRKFQFLGKEYKDDLVICYLELKEVVLSNLTSIEVKNDLLTEFFEEQQNVVHLKIGDTKKSFILVRENNKGMLNF